VSYSTFIPCPMPPDVVETLEAVAIEDLRCEEVRDVPRAGHWPEGFIYHFYRPQISTRSVEVSFERDEFLVRILANAAAEDFELAIAFVRAVCAITDTGPIETSDFEDLDVETFVERHNREWIDERREQEAKGLWDVATREGALVRLQGPTRDFYAGPELCARLETPSPEALEAAMRGVFYLDASRYHPAEIIEKEAGSTKLFAALVRDGVPTLVERSDLIALADRDKMIFISLDKAEFVFPEGEPVDEVQFTLEAIEGRAWEDALARARECQIHLETLESPRRWWKFWK